MSVVNHIGRATLVRYAQDAKPTLKLKLERDADAPELPRWDHFTSVQGIDHSMHWYTRKV